MGFVYISATGQTSREGVIAKLWQREGKVDDVRTTRDAVQAQKNVKGSQIACRDEQTAKAADQIYAAEAQSRPRGEAAKSDRSRCSRRLFGDVLEQRIWRSVAGERRRAAWLWLWWATPFPIRHHLLLQLFLPPSIYRSI